MIGFSKESAPELAAPVLAPAVERNALALPVALATLGALAIAIWLTVAPSQPHAALIPASKADLGDGLLTLVDTANTAAVTAAVSALRLPDAQRAVIERAVLGGKHRIAWIVLTDSIDPDGDVVTVEAGGLVQHVVLSKAWVPVAVPLAGPGLIGITAVRDGGGGGITVALATRAGPVAMRILLPGERIEVAAQ